MSRTRRHILIALTLTPILAAGPKLIAAALETAAGGGGKGTGGFSGFVTFLDNVATYLVFVGAAAGVLGLIASGGMLIAGSPEGGKWLTPHRDRRRDRAARQRNHGLMHAALQAQSSAAGAPAGTAPTPTRPAPAADPTPLRARWTPRLRVSEHPLALTFLVVLIGAAVAQLLTPASAQAIPIVSPIVNGITGLVGGVANDIFVK